MSKILLLFLFVPILHAFAEVVVVNSVGRAVLRGENCDELKREAAAIESWKQTVEAKKVNAKLECQKTKRGTFELDVTSLIPDFAKPYYGKCVASHGPNCWNAALVSAGLAFTIRHSFFTEFHHQINSPLCRELKANEVPRAGDIVAIRNKEISPHEKEAAKLYGASLSESHAYVYVSDNLCFSKNDNSTETPYVLQNSKNVNEVYGLSDPKCMRISSESIPKECTTWSQLFRCKSLSEFWIEHPELKEKYSCHFDKLKEKESILSAKLASQKPPFRCFDVNEFRKDLKGIVDGGDKQLKSNGSALSEEENYIQKTLHQTEDSLNIQLNFIEKK
ncbi:MAG: hypothetical protein KA116_09580 [Proteobacteria bacterium]|nr:hypothetical protein [Pseudomonadota bacterium]